MLFIEIVIIIIRECDASGYVMGLSELDTSNTGRDMENCSEVPLSGISRSAPPLPSKTISNGVDINAGASLRAPILSSFALISFLLLHLIGMVVVIDFPEISASRSLASYPSIQGKRIILN